MSSSKLTVEVWPVTDAGQAPDNEDYVLIHRPADEDQLRYSGSLYVVADGSGGGQRGQLASRYAAQKVINTYYNNTEPDLGLRLRNAVAAANSDLFAYAQQRPELVKLGTTLVAAVIRGEALHVASVGDSRAYLIRDAQIQQITHDHTLVQQLLDENAISPDEAHDHPRRDVVLRMLGAQRDLVIDIYDLRLRPDDALVLCTDGLTRYLADEEISQVVATMAPKAAAERLIQTVSQRSGKDNVTVVTALIRDGGPPLEVNVPHQWNGRPPTFEEQRPLTTPSAQTIISPRPPEDTQPQPDPQQPPPAAEPDRAAMDTVQGMRIVPPGEDQSDWTQVGARTSPEPIPPVPPQQPQQPQQPPQQPMPDDVQPAPPYQMPVEPAPAFGTQQPQQPPYQQPPVAPQQPPPGQFPAAPQGQQGYVPPGYAVDPVTGLPPVPPSGGQQQYGAPGGAYAPRIYQPPGQPAGMPQQRQGIPVGLVIVAGILAIVLTALMVFILVNPFNWDLPFGGDGEQTAAEETPAEAVEQPTQPVEQAPTQETAAEEQQPTPAPTAAPTAPLGMVLVEGGPFTRGVSDDEAGNAAIACINESDEDNNICIADYFDDAQPVEEITLSPFYMDVVEVTNQAYAECVAAEVCTPPGNQQFYSNPDYVQHPVVFVDWNQATEYCEWRGKRLPTEAEWEKAARWDPATGNSLVYPWGDEFTGGVANTSAAGLEGTSAVQAFAQDLSPSGILGMGGNVREWVFDWYFDGYDGLGTLNPTGPDTQPLTEPYRVARGGSYQDISPFARSGHRFDVPPTTQTEILGFRCAQDITTTTEAAPAEGETPAEGEQPAEGEAPAEGEQPAEGEAPAEGEQPAEGDATTEEETPVP